MKCRSLLWLRFGTYSISEDWPQPNELNALPLSTLLGVRSAYELFFIRLLSYRKGNPTKRVLVHHSFVPKLGDARGWKSGSYSMFFSSQTFRMEALGFSGLLFCHSLPLTWEVYRYLWSHFHFFYFCRVSALSSSPTGSSQSRSLTSVARSVLPLCAQNAEGVQVFPLFDLIAFFSPFLTWV